MNLNLEKVSNARELGGIVTKYGTVKRDVFIRSGNLYVMTEKDAETLKKHSLKRVIDLRTLKETEKYPDVLIKDVEYVNVSIIRGVTFGISYETMDGKTIAEMLEAGFVRMQSRNETYSEHMKILYGNFVNDEHCRAHYGEFLKLLANKPVNGSTLWHCSLGKDRVGTCTALLLHCLGASKEVIFDDYIQTNVLTKQNTESILYKVAPYVSAERLDITEAMLLVKREYLQTFFDEAEKKFGGLNEFIAACGVTREDVRNLKKNYLE